MKYLGGKSKIAKRLAGIIAPSFGFSTLVEPFCGGGAMTEVLAPHFYSVAAFDVHEDLILMWNALCSGWNPPEFVSEEDYLRLKDETPSALRGFVGFACSWGGKWFGGYARGNRPDGSSRNYTDESRRSLLRAAGRLGNVKFSHGDYRNIEIPLNCVVYADPPYVGTTGYSFDFDSEVFWKTMNEWAARGGVDVFVSEYEAPPDWSKVWEVTRTRDMKSRFTNAAKVTECLFHKGPRKIFRLFPVATTAVSW